jgi:mono/diheme cytochrome c family protein
MRAIVSLLCAAAFVAAAQPARAADGAAVYKDNCSRCHGDDGKGDTPVGKAMKVKPISGTTLAAEAIAKFVMESDKHKQVAAKLSPAELEAVGKYVLDTYGD